MLASVEQRDTFTFSLQSVGLSNHSWKSFVWFFGALLSISEPFGLVLFILSFSVSADMMVHTAHPNTHRISQIERSKKYSWPLNSGSKYGPGLSPASLNIGPNIKARLQFTRTTTPNPFCKILYSLICKRSHFYIQGKARIVYIDLKQARGPKKIQPKWWS